MLCNYLALGSANCTRERKLIIVIGLSRKEETMLERKVDITNGRVVPYE